MLLPFRACIAFLLSTHPLQDEGVRFQRSISKGDHKSFIPKLEKLRRALRKNDEEGFYRLCGPEVTFTDHDGAFRPAPVSGGVNLAAKQSVLVPTEFLSDITLTTDVSCKIVPRDPASKKAQGILFYELCRIYHLSLKEQVHKNKSDYDFSGDLAGKCSWHVIWQRQEGDWKITSVQSRSG